MLLSISYNEKKNTTKRMPKRKNYEMLNIGNVNMEKPKTSTSLLAFWFNFCSHWVDLAIVDGFTIT